MDGLCFHFLKAVDYFLSLVWLYFWLYFGHGFFCPLHGLVFCFYLDCRGFSDLGFLFQPPVESFVFKPFVWLCLNSPNLGCVVSCVCTWILSKPGTDISMWILFHSKIAFCLICHQEALNPENHALQRNACNCSYVVFWQGWRIICVLLDEEQVDV